MDEVIVAKAYRRDVRVTPRKVGVVLDLIRGKSVDEARAILKNTRKSAAEYAIKILNEAAANAENNFNLQKDKLYVCSCNATPGPTMKRFMPRAKGSASGILKRTSHITICVCERA